MTKYNLINTKNYIYGVEMANKPISFCSHIVVIECPFLFLNKCLLSYIMKLLVFIWRQAMKDEQIMSSHKANT